MNDTQRILDLLLEKPGLKAREIASKLDLDRKTANSHLYGSLSKKLYRDDDFCWWPKEIAEDRVEEQVESVPDDRRRPVQLTGIRAPGDGKFRDPWEPPLKEDLNLELGEHTSIPERFIAALLAMIEEMFRSRVGQKRYELCTGSA